MKKNDSESQKEDMRKPCVTRKEMQDVLDDGVHNIILPLIYPKSDYSALTF